MVSSKVTVLNVKESVDQGHVFGASLTDLSKAFDCLPHNLLIAKLNAYGFVNEAMRFTYDYLTLANKELQYLIHIAHGKKSYQEYLNVQYLDHYCSTL